MPPSLYPTAVYGAPPLALAPAVSTALQTSPLFPGAASLEACGERELSDLTMLAPSGTLERRYALAQGLRCLKPGAPLISMAVKDRGGSRLGRELEAFGCTVAESAKSHYRICRCERPKAVPGLEQALAEGGPQWVEALGLWSQPGVFSWDRIDPGTSLLLHALPEMTGRGADLGCGIGYLARAILASTKVQRLSLLDIDRRAIGAARRNIDDSRAELHWADVNAPDLDLGGLDFVVMNPPFHGAGTEDRTLGQRFIQRAGQVLRKGGVCWLVANRHLPYEAVLASTFARVEVKAQQGGYKVFEARR